MAQDFFTMAYVQLVTWIWTDTVVASMSLTSFWPSPNQSKMILVLPFPSITFHDQIMVSFGAFELRDAHRDVMLEKITMPLSSGNS